MALWKESKGPRREDREGREGSAAGSSDTSGDYVKYRQASPSVNPSSGLDADRERQEALNVDILRQRVRARAAEDPDAAAFGWVARVGAALRRARDVRGLTQTVLSDGTNITQGYLSSLETGKLVRGPTVDVLYRYAAALACDCEITLRDKRTGEVVTTVRSEPLESAAAAAAPGGVYEEMTDKMRT
jgi:transcriptional regulator with XRE-family HTH domain